MSPSAKRAQIMSAADTVTTTAPIGRSIGTRTSSGLQTHAGTRKRPRIRITRHSSSQGSGSSVRKKWTALPPNVVGRRAANQIAVPSHTIPTARTLHDEI